MESNVWGMPWAEFIRNLSMGTLTGPFLVRETPESDEPEWYLYAASKATLVQVVTHKQERRHWRTVDGALSELRRALHLTPFPPVTVYLDMDSVLASTAPPG